VVAPEDGSDVDELLQHADVAMYVAKEQHGGVVRYSQDQIRYHPKDLALVGQLRQAIETDQLVLHYQPKASLATGRVESVEALVRWRHPTLGLLPPDSFIPMVEQTDLINKLTAWVLRRALSDLSEFSFEMGHISMAINVSARNLGHPGFADSVIRELKATGTSPGRLVIEITETALLADPAGAAAVLRKIDAFGVSVSIDDFGSGQTSLGYLSTLPIHELKIDRSFIGDMLVNPAHAAIVRSIVDLGHNLHFHVVGEGVESNETWERLRDSGCDSAQGYLIAHPMPREELNPWFARAATSASSRV
jgi:EAL domain-containing protein (putative c-di-GMP-specific phosphodiesterase class I)